jgi:signal transduction histidine kinase
MIERDLVHTSWDYVRHDPDKLLKVIEDIIEGWIK